MIERQNLLNKMKEDFNLKDNSDKLSWMEQYVYITDNPKHIDFRNLSLYNDESISEEEIKNLMPLIRKMNFGER